MPGKGVITYKFYVLLENNSILCYYSSEQFQEKVKQNKMLGQLGLFDSQNWVITNLKSINFFSD